MTSTVYPQIHGRKFSTQVVNRATTQSCHRLFTSNTLCAESAQKTVTDALENAGERLPDTHRIAPWGMLGPAL